MSSRESNAHPAATPPPPLQTGDLLDGRYRVGPRLGGGGMASVFSATHVALDRPVAVKVVAPLVRDLPGVATRFQREAHAATRLKSEHVVRVFDVGTAPDGAPYMVMELLEGADLAELLERGDAPTPEEAVDLVLQACEALAEVHGLGIVHRDLKPANLFVTRGPDGRTCIKLIDFGISRLDARAEHDAGGGALAAQANEAAAWAAPEMVMGSPRYMAPEQMESAAAADTRADIWGLGAILYELLVGRPPFDGDSLLDIYAAAVRASPPRPSSLVPGLPRALDDVVLSCLRVEAEERHADVAALARALAPFGTEGAAARAEAVARVLAVTRRGANGDGGPPLDRRPSSAPPAPWWSWWLPRSRSAAVLGVAAACLFAVGLAAPTIVGRAAPPGAGAVGMSPGESDARGEAAGPTHATAPPKRARAATRVRPPWSREPAPAALDPAAPTSSWRPSRPSWHGDERPLVEERK